MDRDSSGKLGHEKCCSSICGVSFCGFHQNNYFDNPSATLHGCVLLTWCFLLIEKRPYIVRMQRISRQTAGSLSWIRARWSGCDSPRSWCFFHAGGPFNMPVLLYCLQDHRRASWNIRFLRTFSDPGSRVLMWCWLVKPSMLHFWAAICIPLWSLSP